jgi:hypothetical protein
VNSNFAVSHVFQLLFAGYVQSFRRLRTVIAPAEAKKGSHHARPDGGIWQLTLSLILMFNYYC